MDNTVKMNTMDKMLRELEDIINRQTSLLKKITQLEAENINLGNRFLEKRLPDIHSKADDALTEAITVKEEFTELRDKFVNDNKLNEASADAAE